MGGWGRLTFLCFQGTRRQINACPDPTYPPRPGWYCCHGGPCRACTCVVQDSSDHGAAIHLPPAMNAVRYVQETLSDETWDTWTDTCSIRLDAAGHQCSPRTLFSPSLSVNNRLGLFNYHIFQHPNLTVTSSLFSSHSRVALCRQ